MRRKRLFEWIIVCFGIALVSALLSIQAANPLPIAPLPLTNTRPSNISAAQISAITTLPISIAQDPADLYLPQLLHGGPRPTALPVALLLPGALVNRAHYSQFASAVARHGFAVIVPTHERSLPEMNLSGELSEASQITATLAFIKQETANPNSFFYQKLEPSRIALLGHSHGGFVGLQVIANTCIFPFCSPPFSRPDGIAAGVFYGVNSQDPTTGKFSPTPNDQIPVALIQGSLDSIATPEEAIQTYNLIERLPKALITVKGSNHYGITNRNNPPGAIPDPSPPKLQQAQGVETIAQWTAYFLRTHLYQDSEARRRLYGCDNHPHPSVWCCSLK